MDGKKYKAVCIMHPDGNSGVSGLVTLLQTEGQKCKITATIKGLP